MDAEWLLQKGAEEDGDRGAVRAVIERRTTLVDLSTLHTRQGGVAYVPDTLATASRDDISVVLQGLDCPAGLIAQLHRKAVDGKVLVDGKASDLAELLSLPPHITECLTRAKQDLSYYDKLLHGGDGSADRSRLDCLLDLFEPLTRFAAQSHFTATTLSIIWSILWEVHATSMTGLDVVESRALLLSLLTRHASHAPPFGNTLLTPVEANTVGEYLQGTYHAFYAMYRHVFTAVEMCGVEAVAVSKVCPAPYGVPQPECPRPLYLAVSEERWLKADAEKTAAAAEEAVEHRKQTIIRRQEQLSAQVAAIHSELAASQETDLSALDARVAALQTRLHT